MKPGHHTSEFWLTGALVAIAAGAWVHFARLPVPPLESETSLHHCGLLGLVSTLAALAVRRYLDIRLFLKARQREERGPREPAREFGFGRFGSPDDLDDDEEYDE